MWKCDTHTALLRPGFVCGIIKIANTDRSFRSLRKNSIWSKGCSKTDRAMSSAVSESQKVTYGTRGSLFSSSWVCFSWFLVVSSPIRKPFANNNIIEITLMVDRKSFWGIPFWKPQLKKKRGVNVRMTSKSWPGVRGILLLSFFFGFNHLFAPEESTEMKVASSPGCS